MAIHLRGPGPAGGKAEQEPAPGLPPPSDAPATSEATLIPSLSLQHKPSSTSKHGENVFGMIQFYKREFMFPTQLRLKVMQKKHGAVAKLFRIPPFEFALRLKGKTAEGEGLKKYMKCNG